jgi:RNA polymerase sigma-70 factor (ECF subfamily)
MSTFRPKHRSLGAPGHARRGRADGRELDILGRIQTIRTVNNPDKLGHVGPVADAWAALRGET